MGGNGRGRRGNGHSQNRCPKCSEHPHLQFCLDGEVCLRCGYSISFWKMPYDARCSSCGKDTKVVFHPDGKRPVYCKSCRKKPEKEKQKVGRPQ